MRKGVGMRLSASQLETFDQTTAFGCKRKWWWKYVKGVKSPPDPSQQLGIDVHKSIEDYIKGDDANCLHPIAINGKEHVEEAKRYKGSKQVENKIEVKLFGHEFVGVIDYLNDSPELLDWKTSSDIKRYAKKPEDLPKYIPLVIYAKWFFDQNPLIDDLLVALVYLQTKGKKSERVEKLFTRRGVEAELPRLESLVKEMEAVEKAQAVEDVEGDFDKCEVPYGRGCPYNNLCHGDIMSLFERFGAVKRPPVVIQDIEDAVVVPPDAPASKPELAAVPVPLSPPVPETPPQAAAPAPEAPLKVEANATTTPAKRGPGRPRKAVSGEEAPALKAPEAPIILGGKPPSVSRRSIRHSLTINLGNYESAKVEVEAESETMTLEALAEQVRDDLLKEIAPYKKLKEERLAAK